MKNNVNFNFILPSKTIFGEGTVKRVGGEAKKLSVKRVLIVTSRGMLKREAFRQLTRSLQDHKLSFEVFSDVDPEPLLEDVHNCSIRAKETRSELIIGFGGGSVMDVAKKAAADLRLRKIMVPTTAGTGSEVTHESVLKVNGKKKAFVDEELTPDVAIVDPDLTKTMSPQLTASTGIDALAHSIECYESEKSNALAKAVALSAFNLLKENIKKAIGGDEEARLNMSMGSLMAGIALGNAGTALAHALSYPLSNRGVPHGEAIAMVLPYALEFNGSDDAFVKGMIEVIKTIEPRWDLHWDIEEMAKEVMSDERHLENNPRGVMFENVLNIFGRMEEVFQKGQTV